MFTFRSGERVQYDGQGNERTGLSTGMVGQVVRCFRESVDVYYHELGRVVHHQDFEMRIYLKRLK